MFPLLETIRLEDGRFNNLDYHERRMQCALKALYGWNNPVNLEAILSEYRRPDFGLYKCRVLYDYKSSSVEFSPYELRVVNSLKIVRDNAISYRHKFSDRVVLEELFKMRDGCDDILIVKNDRVTDTSFANIAFRRGKEWFTPASFLLAGTMRQNLLDMKVIREVEIKVGELGDFESFKIINAMLMFDTQEVSIKNIEN